MGQFDEVGGNSTNTTAMIAAPANGATRPAAPGSLNGRIDVSPDPVEVSRRPRCPSSVGAAADLSTAGSSCTVTGLSLPLVVSRDAGMPQSGGRGQLDRHDRPTGCHHVPSSPSRWPSDGSRGREGLPAGLARYGYDGAPAPPAVGSCVAKRRT